MKNKQLIIDGKPVRSWLFAHYLRSHNGSAHVETVQVDAFTLDHAYARLLEAYPMILRQKWQMIEELDAEHFVGVLGKHLQLLPAGSFAGKTQFKLQ